jgi:adenosyl cobinamide kinase/adenosyl cobinamide phosphate guanylyltransferase
MLTRLPQILKIAYKQLGLDKELRNRLSKMTDAEKKEWKENNAEFDIEQLLKSDKREESTTNTGTDTETGGNSR